MFGRLMSRIVSVVLGTVCLAHCVSPAKLGLIGAGLLLNSLTKSMIVPLPVPLPLKIEYGPGPAYIQPQPQYIPIPHPIPVHIPIHVDIPDTKPMVRRMDPMNPKPFDPYCNYQTLSNVDSKIISREPLPTTIKGRTILRHCMQPVPKVNSGKYEVLFKGNQKSSFGSIRVSIKLVHHKSLEKAVYKSDNRWSDQSSAPTTKSSPPKMNQYQYQHHNHHRHSSQLSDNRETDWQW